MAIDEIIRASDHLQFLPMQGLIFLAYASTAKDSPMRKLLRDFWIHESDKTDFKRLRKAGFTSECVQYIAIEMLKIAIDKPSEFGRRIRDIVSKQVCRYHQHYELYPRCGMVDQDLLDPTSLAYDSTVEGAPLRKLVRDYWMYESSNVERQALRASDFPVECLQDIALAVLERFDRLPLDRADLAMSPRTLCLRDKCRYPLHDRQHPQCRAKEERDGM